MNHFKKYLSVLLALTLMLSVFTACGKKAEPAATEAAPAQTTAATEAPAAAETEAPAEQTAFNGHYHVGDKIEDFTITTYDGKEVNLYKVLEEKDMVLLNFWATYCGPCAAEFPAMQEAYEQYSDKVEIIALSGHAPDTDEVLAKYAQEKGMTFPVGRDTINLRERIHVEYIPTSVVIDRFGVICVIASSSEPEASVFTNVFDLYTAEDYTESLFMPNLSAELPDAQPADPAALNAALNGEGSNLVFTNSADQFHWPMIVEEVDGRTVAAASNADVPKSVAAVETQVEAKAGDVLTMEYKFGSEVMASVMRVTVDGQDVLANNLGKDWNTFVYQFEESGTHQITVRLDRSFNENNGGEGLWIDSICLVTGDAAAEVLAKKQQYPVGKEGRISIVNENAKTVAFIDAVTGVKQDHGTVCTDPKLRIEVVLPETAVPETAYLFDATGTIYPLTSYVNGDHYLVETDNTAIADNDFGLIYLYFNGGQKGGEVIFDSLDAAGVFAQLLAPAMGFEMKAVWPEEVKATAEAPVGDGTYTVTYVDQNGDPVPGVMCQVCDAKTCQVFVSDANGVCEFKLDAGNYEIHTLMVPAGYEGDTTTITPAPMGGGELSFTLTKK